MKLWSIDIGDTVVCDYCNEDYSESNITGGIIVEGYAVCPKCEKHDMLKSADYASRPGESFKGFILRTRTQNTIDVCSW